MSRPLEAYPELEEATTEQRNDYIIVDEGRAIRWESIDLDMHISSFYEKSEPDDNNEVAAMFKRCPWLNVSEVARAININKSLLARYIYGISKPSEQRVAQIKEALALKTLPPSSSMKRSIIILFAIVPLVLTSCFCPAIRFIDKDYISVNKQESNLDMNTEFALIGSYRNEWRFYQYMVLDTKSTLNKYQIKTDYCGKPLNFKLYKVNDGIWEKTENIEIKDTIVIMISSHKNLKENNELHIIEKDFPYPGDNIETTIKIPNFEKGKRQMSDSSKVYQFLWNNYNLSL